MRSFPFVPWQSREYHSSFSTFERINMLPKKIVACTSAALLSIATAALIAQDKPTDKPAADKASADKPAAAAAAPATDKKTTTPSGLVITIVEEAKNPGAMPGDIVWMHYTGKLSTGEQFDSSAGQKPFKFTLGKGDVIKGWDEGIVGMKVGEKRNLVIPPDLGYGANARPKIPANSTLVFDIEMVGFARPGQQ
jgi:FK506-binding nuclear protein